ncbi:MAG TPA: pentapeptide repeat-containing protein, partial [archaeon]|nr:pentapeptide repeat-containing protein [archaeon]
GANLTGADLSICDLDNSDFSGAVLTGVSVEGSSVKGTIFELEQNRLEKQGIRYGEGRNLGRYGGEKSVGGYVGGSGSVYSSKSSQYTKKGRYGGGD